MAHAAAAAVLSFAVCCLLVATAPARRPVVDDLPLRLPDAVDREAAAEPLLPEPMQVADAEATDQANALAVPEEGTVVTLREEEEEEGSIREEGTQQPSSLLCLVFRCSSEEEQALDEWPRPAVAGKAEDEEVSDGEEGLYDSDSDWDSDCDSDDEDEGGIVGWFWRLAHGF